MLDINRERDLARAAYTAGRLDEAISKQRAVINHQATSTGEVLISDYRQLAFFLIAADKCEDAVQTLLVVIKARPDNADLMAILGLVYTNLKQYNQAITYLDQAITIDPQSFTAADQLTRCYLAKGDRQTAKHYGEVSLNIKDALYASKSDRNDNQAFPVAPPVFAINKKKKNIIAFSLWGNNERYISGAIRNCELAESLYPGWQCRFYVDDTVPEKTTKNLGARGADVRKMPRPERPYDGLFWRFLVASDPNIERFLVRDCDSVINVKERVAVDAWLASNKHFHVMRDYYTHTDLVMAGMWGGVTGVVEDIQQMIRVYSDSHIQSRVMDQTFLNECLWPIIRDSCLVHDSCFETRYSCAYPPYCHLPPGRHIGQDEFSFRNAQSARNKIASEQT